MVPNTPRHTSNQNLQETCLFHVLVTLNVSTQVESTYNKFHVCKAFDVTHFDIFTASETATTHSRGKTLITPKSFRVPPRDISLLRPHQAATDPLPDSLCLAGPDVIGFQSTCGSGPACLPPRRRLGVHACRVSPWLPRLCLSGTHSRPAGLPPSGGAGMPVSSPERLVRRYRST